MRIESATHRATDRREAMKTFELLSIIGSVIAVGITLGVVMLGSVAAEGIDVSSAAGLVAEPCRRD